MRKGVIVFSGYNQRAVIALLRTLKKDNIPYHVIASSADDTIFQTIYGDNAITRNHAELNMNDLLDSLSLASRELNVDSVVIAPSTESLNRHLLKNRMAYEKQGYEIPLADEALYIQISDKSSFTDMCRLAGIRVPSDAKDIEALQPPFVAKPVVYQAADGSTPSPVIIRTNDEREKFKEIYDARDFYFQEYVNGESYYLLYYVYENGQIDKLSQQNLIQQPGGKSIIAAITSDIHNDAISGEYERLLQKSGYRGLIMIEVKKNASGEYLMIEANPRMWGPSQLFVDADKNLFKSLLYDYGVLNTVEMSADASVAARYYWGGGAPVAGVTDDELDYHGYDMERFEQEKADWAAADIYNRDDTPRLYKSEMRGR